MIPGVVGGTQTYATSLIRALAASDQTNDYVVYVNRESADLELVDAPNFEIVRCNVRATSRPARYAYEQGVLPLRLRRDRIDVVHSMGYVGPLLSPCPQVVTVHDLIYVGFQDHMGDRRRRMLRLFVRATVRRAAEVITVSENSKNEIVADMHVDPARVTVIHEAGRETRERATGSIDSAGVIARYGLRPPYIAAFGSLNPGKNIARLVDAFGASAHTDTQLVLIGHLDADVRAQTDRSGTAQRVVTTGYVPDADVLPLIGGAAVFAFPSVYEGFGLPVLDAQTMGVPVVCSGVASLPEVAGDGAVFFDPHSVDAITNALDRVLDDAGLRQRLVENGRNNAARFSWSRAAAETLRTYERVVARG